MQYEQIRFREKNFALPVSIEVNSTNDKLPVFSGVFSKPKNMLSKKKVSELKPPLNNPISTHTLNLIQLFIVMILVLQ